jgi:asparagine synthase (glutamine-hydrolysing)
MRQDKMSMAHSIENRVPFLDNEMVSTALRIPGDLLINKHDGKTEAKLLLKQLCANEFNELFAFREKMGFGIPLRSFLSSNDFRQKWKDKLLPGMERRKIFATMEINNWVNDLASASVDQLDAIWLMSGFEIWAQQYLD